MRDDKLKALADAQQIRDLQTSLKSVNTESDFAVMANATKYELIQKAIEGKEASEAELEIARAELEVQKKQVRDLEEKLAEVNRKLEEFKAEKHSEAEEHNNIAP